ncbi:MAG: Phosphoglucosamine mutase [Candidatus Methanocomedens sp.]|nr:MAG: Phosphoglucosamine mutase [ANME-2 cluster archaeon]
MKLFGSSGIRGLTNVDVTPQLALNVGKVAGKRRSRAVIARDPRVAGIMIEEAVSAGLMSAGVDVTRLGVVPTPTLAYTARNFDVGVMITASHNPARDIGIKLWNPDGMAFDSRQQHEIEQAVEVAGYSRADWDRIGLTSDYEMGVEDHIRVIIDTVGPLENSPKVVIDCGSGAGSVISPLLLRMMGCKVLALNSQLDGHFPARDPEPKEANLGLLMKTVQDWGADMGIAHDGDADRMMAVDDKGRFVGGDQLLAIFAAHEDADSIVVPVDTSMVVDDALPGARVIRSRVGDVYVAEAMKKEGAKFGGEPSGSWIFPRLSFCPDGIYAAARLIEIVGSGNLSEMVDELPIYQTIRTGTVCSNERKAEVMAAVYAELSSLGEVSDIDGIRVEVDGGWVLVRPSGTEPKIRITAESRSGVDVLFHSVCRIVNSATGSTCD